MCHPSPPATTTHTITISATTAEPFPPTLDDDGFVSITEPAARDMTTTVNPGDKVIWQKGGDVSSIDDIAETAGSDVFSINPSALPDGSWSAVVGNLPSGTIETYSISYSVTGAPDNPYLQDPKLKMH